MPKEIEFRGLSLKDALDLAVLIEEDAEERYVEFAAQMESHATPEAARFFRYMAGNEKRHGAELEARRKQLFGDAPRAVTPSQIWDVEAPDYDKTRAFMSPRDAMKVALECEVKAYDYFTKALPTIVDATVKALFVELQAEEVAHQELVKKVLAKLVGKADVDPNDYVDKPVAQ